MKRCAFVGNGNEPVSEYKNPPQPADGEISGPAPIEEGADLKPTPQDGEENLPLTEEVLAQARGKLEACGIPRLQAIFGGNYTENPQFQKAVEEAAKKVRAPWLILTDFCPMPPPYRGVGEDQEQSSRGVGDGAGWAW